MPLKSEGGVTDDATEPTVNGEEPRFYLLPITMTTERKPFLFFPLPLLSNIVNYE